MSEKKGLSYNDVTRLGRHMLEIEALYEARISKRLALGLETDYYDELLKEAKQLMNKLSDYRIELEKKKYRLTD